jgi:hypothetical protein
LFYFCRIISLVAKSNDVYLIRGAYILLVAFNVVFFIGMRFPMLFPFNVLFGVIKEYIVYFTILELLGVASIFADLIIGYEKKPILRRRISLVLCATLCLLFLVKILINWFAAFTL